MVNHNTMKEWIRSFALQNTNNYETEIVNNPDFFVQKLVSSYDKILELKDKEKGKSALVVAHGPSLSEIDKQEYSSFVNITCNLYSLLKTKNPVTEEMSSFYDKDYQPDYWVGANSYEELIEPIKECHKNGIPTLVAIPKKRELEKVMENPEIKEELSLPWLWEIEQFQRMLALENKQRLCYSRCNTVTNHMIAWAIWLGCSEIHVAGFDLSYANAMKKYGTTHAGYVHDGVLNENLNSTTKNLMAFEDQRERNQIVNDLNYLAEICKTKEVTLRNLSHEINNLPEFLSK
jgi:hypothetical protein